MPHDPKNPPATQALAPSVDKLSARADFRSEHVLLESEEVHEALSTGGRTISRRFKLRNRVSRRNMVLIAFEEGFLSVVETHRGQQQPERSIDLRCVDPAPVRSRHLATAVLGVAAALTVAAAAAGLLAIRMQVPDVVVMAAFISGVAAPFAWWVFVRRTEERTSFQTRHGRAIVLTLVAHLGCTRAFRARSRELAQVIDEMHGRDGRDRHQQLRAEMREHYRLAESGVIGADESAAAIRRTLAEFG